MLIHHHKQLAMLLLTSALVVQDAGPPSAQQASAGARPNVLVIVMDDVSERDMDRVPTPRFDALAAAGMRFRRAYGAPVCSPARRMLNFGMYWERDSGTPCTGQNYKLNQPSPESLSLARMFRSAGYATALIGKWHLGSFDGVEAGEPWPLVVQKHGFQTWRAGMSANVASPCIKLGNYENWQRVDDLEVSVSAVYNTAALRDAAIAWIEEQRATPDTPWFGMLCFQAAHGPFHVPPDSGERRSSHSFRKRYELMIEDMDRAIGEVLESVDLKDTLVILLGDNGTPERVPYTDAEEGRGKTTTFEGGIHVPMIWAGPGVTATKESSALVSFVDVLPTLAGMIGYASEAIDELDGLSIQNVLRDPTQRAHDFVWAGCVGPNVRPGGDFAVVTERWKLRLADGVTSLYDLEADPEERVDLALASKRPAQSEPGPGENEHAERIKQLMALLIETRPDAKQK